MEGEELYRRFLETQQEPVRLKAALEGFFREECREEQREAYGAYLKRRIRPAMEALIAEDDVESMQKLEELGWIGGAQLGDYLRMARRKGKLAATVWLMNLQHEKYGARDRDFSL